MMRRQKINIPQYTHNLTWKLYRFLPLNIQKKRLLKPFNDKSNQLLHFPIRDIREQSVILFVSELPENMNRFRDFLTAMSDQVIKLRLLCRASISHKITGIPHSWIINYLDDQMLIDSIYWGEVLRSINRSEYQQLIFIDKSTPFNLAFLGLSTKIPLRISFHRMDEDWMNNVLLQPPEYLS